MDLSPLHNQVPAIIEKRRLKVSRFFTVEQLDLQFSNNCRRTYERLAGGRGAVLAVPFDGKYFYMTSEYACGSEAYELGFVKGKIDGDESPMEACNRELQEEIGYASKNILPLKDILLVAPGMLSLKMYAFFCQDLYTSRLCTGDEPEPIKLVKVLAHEAKALIFENDSPLREARAIACLALALHKIGEL